MPSLIDFRRRIRSVKNTQQITKAMKMVSAAKLRRAQERAIAARPYASGIRDNAGERRASRASRIPRRDYPLLAQRPEKRILRAGHSARSRLGRRVQRQRLAASAQSFCDEHRADKSVEADHHAKRPRLFRKRILENCRRIRGLYPRARIWEDAREISRR